MPRTREEYFRLALAVSISAHLLLAYYLLFEFHSSFEDTPPAIYSVTIEGGKSLGGVAQVAKDDKSMIAPPKNVSEPAPEVKEKKADDDAEVSLAEKKKEEEKKAQEEKEKKKEAEEKKKEEEKKKKEKEEKDKKKEAEDLNKNFQKAMQRYTGESTDAGNKGFGAGALGGTKMGGGIVRPPEFFTYKKLIEGAIKGGWHWIDTTSPLISQVRFQISETGEISGVEIFKSSGNPEFDESAIRAVKKASPLPPPPPTVFEFFKDVRMTFDPRE